MIHIKDHYDYEEYYYDEDPHDLDEFLEDEFYRCPECGKKMRKTYIVDDAYGTTVRIPTYECDYC